MIKLIKKLSAFMLLFVVVLFNNVAFAEESILSMAESGYLKNHIRLGVSNAASNFNNVEIKSSKSYYIDEGNYGSFYSNKKKDNIFVGINLSYLRSVSERVRVGIEFQQNLDNLEYVNKNTLPLNGYNYETTVKSAPSQNLSFQTEYDFFQSNSKRFSMFVNGGIGASFNTYEVKTKVSKVGTASSGRAAKSVSFKIRGNPTIVISGNSTTAVVAYCEAQASSHGYDNYKNTGTSYTGNFSITGGNVSIGSASNPGVLTCMGTNDDGNSGNENADAVSTDTKTSKEFITTIIWNLGLGASYNFTPAWGLAAKINYAQSGDIKYNKELNGVTTKADFTSPGTVSSTIALTYRF